MARTPKTDAALIRELAELLDETGLTEIEIGNGDHHIRVARHGIATAPPAPSAAIVTPQIAPTGSGGESAQEAAAPANSAGAVTSPMVGTIYMAPEPGGSPFVSVGATVRPGDTLFIIEAMKTMNPVKATTGGTVVRILVEDAQPVEFGEALAEIG